MLWLPQSSLEDFSSAVSAGDVSPPESEPQQSPNLHTQVDRSFIVVGSPSPETLAVVVSLSDQNMARRRQEKPGHEAEASQPSVRTRQEEANKQSRYR